MKVANFSKLNAPLTVPSLTPMAPPDCQVEERTNTIEQDVQIVHQGKGAIRFCLPATAFQLPFGGKESITKKKNAKRRAKQKKAKYANKIAKPVDPFIQELEAMNKKIENEIKEFEAMYQAYEAVDKKSPIISDTNQKGSTSITGNETKMGVLSGKIPYGIADSGATSSVVLGKLLILLMTPIKNLIRFFKCQQATLHQQVI